MGWPDRVPVPVTDAGVVLRYADGHTETAMLGAGKVLGWLGKMRVYPPPRYVDERPAESLTREEVAHCRTLYRQGMSWRELGEAFGVPDKDLRRRVMGTEPAARAIAREAQRERDLLVWEMSQRGLRQCVIARRLGISEPMVSKALQRVRAGYYDA